MRRITSRRSNSYFDLDTKQLTLNNPTEEDIENPLRHGLPIEGVKFIENVFRHLNDEEVRIRENRIAQLSRFPSLTSLELESIYAPHVASLWALTSLPRLKRLSLWGFSNVIDVGDLAVVARTLTSLTSLTLGHFGGLRGVGFLSSMVSLRELSLSYCWGVERLDHLASLTSLTSLDISHCISVKDLQPVFSLPSLTSLNMDDTRGEIEIVDFACTGLVALKICTHMRAISERGALRSILGRVRGLPLRKLEITVGMLAMMISFFPPSSGLSPRSSAALLRPPPFLDSLVELKVDGGCESGATLDLDIISRMFRLTHLEVAYVELANLGSISRLASLLKLELASVFTNDCEIGGGHGLLSEVSLVGDNSLHLLKLLGKLRRVRRCEIYDCSELRDMEQLNGMPQLSSLHVEGCENFNLGEGRVRMEGPARMVDVSLGRSVMEGASGDRP